MTAVNELDGGAMRQARREATKLDRRGYRYGGADYGETEPVEALD